MNVENVGARQCLKPWLVGENNPYGPEERFALYHEPPESAGGRLCRLVLGLEPHVYRALYVRRNLLAQPKWSVPAAREAAKRIASESGGATLVLLGAKVCAAFGFPFVPFTHAREVARTTVVLPHPSGLSRAWNEPGAFERARECMREAGALP